MATRILQGLDRDPSEITLLLNGEKANDTTFKPLDMDIFHAISDWYYYAILSLAETEDFQSSPAWIARRLGISHNVAEVAIERLLKLDLIKLDPATKKLKATGEQLAAVSDIARPALKKACRQNIELAQNALDETDFSERDFTAITLCFDPERMHEAKKMLKNFRRNFCRTMESGRKKEVYKLTLQLFPLTKKGIP